MACHINNSLLPRVRAALSRRSRSSKRSSALFFCADVEVVVVVEVEVRLALPLPLDVLEPVPVGGGGGGGGLPRDWRFWARVRGGFIGGGVGCIWVVVGRARKVDGGRRVASVTVWTGGSLLACEYVLYIH